jgi:hypothetical protein
LTASITSESIFSVTERIRSMYAWGVTAGTLSIADPLGHSIAR